ncbi:Armc2, partial [Symbiodinium sp. CCMP2456]
EALVECARALGNISRHEDVRQWMVELRIDEVLSILLSHHDRDLVFYSCGAFVNLAADPEVSQHLREGCGVLEKLAAVLLESDEAAKFFGQCKSFADYNYSTDPKTGSLVQLT